MSTATLHATSDHLDLADMRRRIKAIFIGSVGNLVKRNPRLGLAHSILHRRSLGDHGADHAAQSA